MEHINDDHEHTQQSDSNLDKALHSYKVDDVSSDLSARILAQAAAFPRKNEKSSFSLSDFLLAPFQIFLFRRDYLPVTFALFMLGLMIVTGYQQKHSDANKTDMQNYAHILLPEDNMVAGYTVNFHEELSQDMYEFIYTDLEQNFEI